MPKLGRPDNRRSRDVLQDPNFLQDKAPYGTQYTPNIKYRIVGGVLVPVLDERSLKKESVEQQQQDTHPLKPASVPSRPDLRLPLPQEAVTEPTEEHQSSMLQLNEQEDSQSRYHRGRFFNLAQHDNSLSARFGGVPVAMEREDLLETAQVYPGGTGGPPRPYGPLNPHSALPPISSLSPVPPLLHEDSMASLERVQDLYNLLPRNSYLPDEPLLLNTEQEEVLMSEIGKELINLDSSKLKEVYLDLTHYDTQLLGYIPYQDMQTVLMRAQVNISPALLRLLGGLFVSRIEKGKVNYEKMLSLLGAAYKNKSEKSASQPLPGPPASQRRSEEYPAPDTARSHQSNPYSQRHGLVYYHSDRQGQHDDDERRSLLRERDDARLFRQLEAQVRQSDGQFRPINFESLRLSFQRADSLCRGTLSGEQMKAICLDHRLPVDEATLQRLIQRCHYRGGGQYDWQQFVSFLERVTPLDTGLRIPSSRKPLDYQKQYPEPAASWPHAESPHAHSNPSSPVPGQDYQDPQRQPSRLQELQREIDTLERQLADAHMQNGVHQSHPVQRNSPPPPPLAPMAAMTTGQGSGPTGAPSVHPTGGLSSRPPDPPFPKKPLSDVQNEPWFNRFMRLADALYRNDTESRGFLPKPLVQDLVQAYNEDFNLGLDARFVEHHMETCMGSSGTRVDINAFLKRLAT